MLEVLAVTSILAIVMALLMPSLAASRRKAQGIICMNNLRHLQMAWTMYSGEHNDSLPAVNGGSSHESGKWVCGWLDFSSNPDNTNTALLMEARYSQIGPYLKLASAYHCPADPSSVVISGKEYRRVRSISMNCWMNYIGTADIGQDVFRIYRKLADITEPPPDEAWVLMDERADSINDGMFQTNLKDRRQRSKIVDFPGKYHDGGASITFADGHAEVKHWRDSRTVPAIRDSQLIQLDVPSPDNPDVAWLQEHSSSRRIDQR